MPCGWEGNRKSGVALAIRYSLQWLIHLRAQARPMKGKWAPRLHSSWGMAHFTFLHLRWSSRIANRTSGQAFTLLSVLYFISILLEHQTISSWILASICIMMHDVTFELFHAFNQRQLIPQLNIIASFIFDIISNHSLSQKYPKYANYASHRKLKVDMQARNASIRACVYSHTHRRTDNVKT